MDSENQAKFMYLLEKIHQPLTEGPRGGDKNVFYIFSDPNKVQSSAVDVDLRTKRQEEEMHYGNRRKEWTITSPNRQELANISAIGRTVPRTALFSDFLPSHYQAANELQEMFMKPKNREDFLSLAAATRDLESMNPHLWTHAFSHAALRRKDMRGFRMPAIWEIMPDQFIPLKTLKEAERKAQHEQATENSNTEQKVEMPVVAKSSTIRGTNPEWGLNYFREDIGVNSHHYHWHLVYVKDAPATGPDSRDRKGELFYYMHHNLIARYDAERLANGLSPTKSLDYDQSVKISEGYFPQIGSVTNGVVYGSRQEGTALMNVSRYESDLNLRIDIDDVHKWKQRLYESIDAGFVTNRDGSTKALDEKSGIDILGDIIGNGGQTSPSPSYYGYMHGLGHMLISYQHDPENRYDTPMGVMGTTTSAMRDPVFYRLHKFMDEIFNYYKGSKLHPYTYDQLTWPSVKVETINVQVQSETEDLNTLITHWTNTDVEVSRGLGSKSNKKNVPVLVPLKHLNHEPFQYHITVTNNENENVSVTIRLFMAPRYDARGRRYPLGQQRIAFFEMDKFIEELSPGKNEITRESAKSTVTIPWSQGFQELEHWLQGTDYAVKEAVCGCGWPHHFLLPRGTTGGMSFDLFVMLTNADEDIIQESKYHFSTNLPAEIKPKCKESLGYCGILNELYPDKKSMGFPFDRRIQLNGHDVMTLEDFIAPYSNMKTVEIIIKHKLNKVTAVHKGQGNMPAEPGGSSTRARLSSSPLSDWVHVNSRDTMSDSLSDDNF